MREDQHQRADRPVAHRVEQIADRDPFAALIGGHLPQNG
jgi:hypothetical protein